MNQCRRIQSGLSRAHADAATLQSEPDVRAHLAACAACRSAAANAVRVAALLRGMSAPALPISFEAGLQAKIAAARDEQERASPISRMVTKFQIAFAVPSRRTMHSIGLGASLAAAATVAGVILFVPLHPGGNVSQPIQPSGVSSLTNAPAGIEPLSGALPQGDAAFIAACSSQQAQDASAQVVSDPSASALAASLDESRAAPGDLKSDSTTDPSAD